MAWEYRGYRIERKNKFYIVTRSDESHFGSFGTLLKAQAAADAEIKSIQRPWNPYNNALSEGLRFS